MSRAVLCIVLALPHLARAQVEEINPPGSSGGQIGPGPPTATPAPPTIVVRTRYSRYRTSWYIGFGLGAGAGTVSTDKEDHSGGGLGFSIIRIGWVARPWLLLGFEASTWFRMEGDLFDSNWIQFLHYDIVSTFFPLHDRGFYVKGGIGVGAAIVGKSDLTLQGQQTEQEDHTGVDLRTGVGYEWQLMKSFNLGADLIYAVVIASGARAHDVTAQLTFTWY